ncbi:3-hydroxyacyl-CoA dehydrogenase family protein [Desulfosporosinus burensis]
MKIRTIGIVGTGTMGTGIAHIAAMAGYDVIMRDIDMTFIDRAVANMDKFMARTVEKGKMTEEVRQATLGRLKKTTALEDMSAADFIIEVVLEKMDLKKEVFQTLNKVCRPEVILATNTSSMSITEIATASGRPDKVCGMHFFNPAQIMRLVEIIRGAQSSDETIADATDLARAFGKTTVEVKKDSPGFIVNRILMPQMVEAARLLQEGVASVEDIDTAVKLGLNYPMGMMELFDFGGIDLAYFVMEYFADEFSDNQYAAPQIIKQMCRAGKHGRKSGEGFYKY